MRRGGVPGLRRRMGRPVQHVLRLPCDFGGFGFDGSSSSGSTRPTRNATSGDGTDASLHDDSSRSSTSSTRSPRPPPPPTAQASASRPTAEHVTGGVRECFDAGRWQLAHECPGHLAAGHERFERDGREVLTTFDPSSRYADWRRRHARAPRRRPRSRACPGAAAPSFDRGLRLGLGRSSATDRTSPILRGRPSCGEGGAGGLVVLAASAPFMAMGTCRPVAGSANGTTGRSPADRAPASPRPASPCGMGSGPAVPVGKGSTTGRAAGARSETGAKQDGRRRTVAVVEGEALRAIGVSPSPPAPGAVPADPSDVRSPRLPTRRGSGAGRSVWTDPADAPVAVARVPAERGGDHRPGVPGGCRGRHASRQDRDRRAPGTGPTAPREPSVAPKARYLGGGDGPVHARDAGRTSEPMRTDRAARRGSAPSSSRPRCRPVRDPLPSRDPGGGAPADRAGTGVTVATRRARRRRPRGRPVPRGRPQPSA